MASPSKRPLFLFFAFATVAACDDGSSQPAARDRAVDAVCARFSACGEVGGSGDAYASMESCRVDQASVWEKLWPPQECDGRIDPEQLDLCINAINAAECGEGLDVLNVLLNKCPKSKVCSAPADK